MNWNKSLMAFDDCHDDLERALASERGIKITYDSYGKAVEERSRFNYYRKLNRAENEQIYEKGHMLHGRSPYDVLVLRIPRKGQPDSNVLYIERRSTTTRHIEEL